MTPTAPLPGSEEAAGTGGSRAKTEAPPSYTLPGFYGSGSTTLTGGEGRLARPRFRYQLSVSQGFDDNIFTTPSKQIKQPDFVFLVTPGTQAFTTLVPVTTTTYELAFAGPIVFYRPVTTTTLVPVVTPAVDPVFQTIKAPDPQKRTGSQVSRAEFSFDSQMFTRRSLFTFDLNVRADYYWDRPAPTKKDEFSGSFSLSYLYRLTPRLQISATANSAYLTQPDLTRINTPDRPGTGDSLSSLARLNLSYRWTPRLTSTVSVSANASNFVESASQTGDSFETGVGTELRYLWSPRYTLIGEVRHSMITYPNAPQAVLGRDSSTNTLLIGAEVIFTARLRGSLRLGEAIRTFTDTGKSSSAPYGEASLTYNPAPTSQVAVSSRYGFEEPPDQSTEVVSLRTSISYFKAITPRLSGTAALNGSMRTSTNKSLQLEVTENTVDANMSLQYRFSRDFKLDLSFSFTKSLSSSGERDYDRSRVFLGGEYTF